MKTTVSIFGAAVLIGLFTHRVCADPYGGYTLYGRNNATTVNLMNLSNQNVRTWTGRNGGYCCYMLDNGHVMRTAIYNNPTFNAGGSQGWIQDFNWDGTLAWEFSYSNSSHQAHHAFAPMPNGNVLMIAWEYKSAAQAQQAGRNGSQAMWPDHIIEVEPSGTNGGTIVWEWHVWDHLIQDFNSSRDNYGVVGDHPELIDINLGGLGPGGGDWMHMNGIGYNPERDEIVFSSHSFDEIYVIDHSTTTAEAAGHTGGNRGHGGDILYRWGKPANYDTPGAQVFNVVHSAHWVPAGFPGEGNIILFNNREGQGTSIVMELTPPRDGSGNYIWTPGSAYGPEAATWSYTAAGFYSNHLGWCDRLPNGNTIISESTSGYLFEVDAAGNTQWSFTASGEAIAVHRLGYCDPSMSAIGDCDVTNLTIWRIGSDIQLRWAAETNAETFRIYRMPDASTNFSMGTLVNTVTTTTALLVNEAMDHPQAFYLVVAGQ